MRLDHKELRRYLKTLSANLEGRLLGVPALFNSKVFWFPILNDEYNEHLMIGLRNNAPFILVATVNKGTKTMNDPLLNPFRENLDCFYIKAISLKEDDYIATIEIETEEGEEKELIIELFNTKPNLFLVDKNKHILASFRENDEETYSFKPVENFSSNGEGKITEIYKEFFKQEKEKRVNEKYDYFLKDIALARKKIRRAFEKEVTNDESLLDEAKALIDQGERILSCGTNLNEHRESITDYEEKEIKLDASLTIRENAEQLLRKARKFHNRVTVSHENMKRLNEQDNFYKDLLCNFENSFTDEQRDKVIESSGFYKVKGKAKETPFNVPYKINYNGLIIYFGKNAKQNDYLSFSLPLDRDFMWLHVKDYHGAHVVLCKKKPNEKELTLAGEVALIVSHLDTALVSYTLKKNIRKGKNMGEVIMKNYSTMKINNISDIAKELVSKAEKAK